MAKKEKEETGVMVPVSPQVMAELANDFPVEEGFTRIQPPRLGFYSQDQTEEVKNKKTGKKEIQITTEAGTFYLSQPTDEKDPETDKVIWENKEIGMEVEGVIVYQRKQLRMYDEATEQYTSSPVYDSEEDVIPLYCDKKEVARGTPKELKARYEYEEDGKTKSHLEDNRILYVLYEDELFQLNLRGSSMYSYMSYTRELKKKGIVPPAVVTRFSSEPREKGKIKWNQMVFETVGPSTPVIDRVRDFISQIKGALAAEKYFFSSKDPVQGADESDEEYQARRKQLKDF